MRIRARRWLAIVGLVFVGLGTFVAFDGESHHTSGRYLVWRYFAIGDWRNGARFLNVDPEFRRSFEGQSRARLMRWFPELLAGASRPDVCPVNAAFSAMQRQGEWMGGTPWLVLYDSNGLVKEIMMPKGC